MTTLEYDPMDRQAFLAECERFLHSVEGRKGYVDTSETRGVQADEAERMILKYFDALPILPLSRCPFCEQVNTFSIDTVGLDGLWWTFPSLRPELKQSSPCPHFFNLMGAVKLHRPVHVSSFQVRPGPEIPFVVPEVIQHETVKAVVSQIQVGNNIAYPISYYSEVQPKLTYKYVSGADVSYCLVHFPDTSAQERLNMPPTWGQHFYEWFDGNGKRQVSDAYLPDRRCDFEIAPWIAAGKLLWIKPEDETLTLHNTLDDCPYLDLPGERHIQRIQDGEVW